MRRVFYHGVHQYEFCRWNERPDGLEQLYFEDFDAAHEFLRSLMSDPLEVVKLRSLAIEMGLATSTSGDVVERLLEHLAWDLLHCRLLVTQEARVYRLGVGQRRAPPAPPPDPTGPPPVAPKRIERKDWIAVQLVDEDEKPIPKERYKITLPNAAVEQGELDGDGSVRFDDVEPGTCYVEFPKLEPVMKIRRG